MNGSDDPYRGADSTSERRSESNAGAAGIPYAAGSRTFAAIDRMRDRSPLTVRGVLLKYLRRS